MGLASDIDQNVKPKRLGVRHAQVTLIFFAMMIAFSMRANMSMAIVDMTNVNQTDVNQTNANNVPHFDWDASVKSAILSSFFWGYVVLQVPAGELSGRLGGKALITTAISVNSLISLLMSTAASIGGWKLVCACRVVQGLAQALIYPSVHHLVSQWVPLEEKGLLTTVAYAGGQLGISLQLLVSGFLASAWGWPAIFYANGIMGAIWTAVYLVFGADSPETSRFISKEEVLYIQRSLKRTGEQKKYPTPWLKIMTSLPFWAVIVAHCGQNWGFFTLMTEIPTYMDKVLKFPLTNNGILSSLPYLVMFSLSFPMGFLTDVIIRHKWLNVANTRKLFNSIGLWGPAICLVALACFPEGDSADATQQYRRVVVVLLTAAVGINAGQYLGFMLVHIDLAPNFSGNLMGVTNFLANIVSIIAPLVCGAIIKGAEDDAAEWRKVFFLAAGVYFCTNLFFVLFSTSEKQPWNEPTETDVEMKAPDKATSADEKY